MKKRTQISKSTKKPTAKTARKEPSPSVVGQVLRALGGLGGSALGGLVGAPSAGSSLGSSMGAALSKWLGAGDYTVSSNSLVAKASAGVPMMHSHAQSVTIRHKELVGTISGSTNFAVQQAFVINPGLDGTFPWLSNIAQSYQQYEVKGMVFHYVPTSGMAISGTNSALGSVMIQTSYRSNDAPPTSKTQMMNEFWSNEVVPSEPMAHPIECDPKENPFNVHYVRGTTVPVGDNQLLYDLGVTYVATQGMQSSNIVGDLWVTYEIELKKPIVASNVTRNNFKVSLLDSTVLSTPFSGEVGSFLGSLPVTFTGSTITFPQGLSGTYQIWVYAFGTLNGACSWTGAPTLSGCIPAGLDGFYSTYPSGVTTSTGLTTLTYTCAIEKANPSDIATVILPTAAAAGSLINVRLAVYEVI